MDIGCPLLFDKISVKYRYFTDKISSRAKKTTFSPFFSFLSIFYHRLMSKMSNSNGHPISITSAQISINSRLGKTRFTHGMFLFSSFFCFFSFESLLLISLSFSIVHNFLLSTFLSSLIFFDFWFRFLIWFSFFLPIYWVLLDKSVFFFRWTFLRFVSLCILFFSDYGFSLWFWVHHP